MAIPKIRELYNPILDYLYQYGASSLAEIRYAMARSFYIPDREAFNYDDDKPTLFMGRVNNACFNLYHATLIIRVRRGVYDISKNGRNAIDEEDFVDSDYLWRFPSYENYIRKKYEQGARASGAEKDKPLPAPNNNYEEISYIKPEKPRPQFSLMELLTIEDMVKLRDQDARFANMIATGEYLYDDGIIKHVPQEVLQHDMSYQEYKATTLMHSSNQAIMCFKEAITGQMVTAPKVTIEGYHKTKKGTRPWSNPYPPTPGAESGGGKGPDGGKGSGNGGTGGYNGNRNSDMVQEMLDFIQQSHGDFNKCFKHLMDVYGISEVMLEQKSGINKKQIQRYRNDSKFQPSVEELTAIMLVLQTSSYILEAFISLTGQDPKSDKWKPYCIICDMMKYAKYEEVNAQCRKYNRTEIFPQNLSGPIS